MVQRYEEITGVKGIQEGDEDRLSIDYMQQGQIQDCGGGEV